MKDAKLTPRITETAKNLWLVYFAITLACIGALMLVGLDWFEAPAMPSRRWAWAASPPTMPASATSTLRRSNMC